MDDIPKSHFQQTVCLGDWWLVKAENDDGRRLAVSGFSSRENQAMRVFSSAPILKRHDFFTLETTDGICVILKGFINKARTIENGFPSDVQNHFVLGFPPYWKEYDEKFLGGTNSCNFEVNGLHGAASEIKLSKLDAESVKDEFRQISETPNQDKDPRKVKMQGKIRKTKNKAARSLSTPAAADNQKDNVFADENSSREKAKASGKKTRRNLTYETPKINREKKKVPDISPESLSFNRSRSGRLLMPTLAFWRNQRAIYSADRTITGIEEGIHSEQPRKGSKSMPRKKRKATNVKGS